MMQSLEHTALIGIILPMQLKAYAVRAHTQAAWITLDAMRCKDKVLAAFTSAGLSLNAAQQKMSMILQCADALLHAGHAPSTPAAVVFVPGRIEVFGKHTDYCGGRSLLCAVDRGLCMAAVAAPHRMVRMTELKTDSTVRYAQEQCLTPVPGGWSNYSMTVARRIARDFPQAECGMDAVFIGDLPLAAGLSSSSALIIATWLMHAAVGNITSLPEYKQHLARVEDLVTYFGAIESGRAYGPFKADGGVGTTGGSQDHAAIMLSNAGEFAQISYSPMQIERRVSFPDGWRIAVANSAVVAEKTGAAMDRYNALSRRAARVLEVWNSRTGRTDDTLADALISRTGAIKDLAGYLKDEPSDAASLVDRLHQFAQESMELVPAATEAIKHGDIKRFGELAFRSQQASEQWLGNQVPQTIALIQAAHEAGAAAASAFGAGFGGSGWAMIRTDQADTFLHQWLEGYRRRVDPQTGQRASGWVTDAGPGALWLGPAQEAQ